MPVRRWNRRPSIRPCTTRRPRIWPRCAPIDKTKQEQRDPAAVAERDAEFHGLIARAAHNRVLLLAKEPASMLVRPTTALIIFMNRAGIPRLIAAHEHILAALEKRDAAMGRLWVDRHLRD